MHRIPRLIAILRGVKPDEVVAIGEALVAGGFRAIEVPLNSPDPLESIKLLAAAVGDRCLVGAGTVLAASQVDAVRTAGGKLIVSPNADAAVIGRTVALDLVALPGVATATEAFAALNAGAGALKLFPAVTYGPGHLKALASVLPVGTAVYAVGGIKPDDIPAWISAGAAGFGVGGELYRPGDTADDVGRKASAFVRVWAPLSASC
jgi:2-dehydro-3-deoxyphosphogalactonate aldolase